MFTGFRMILEEATNQKWQLTQKIDELQLKEDYLFDEIAKIYGFNNYSELQLARNISHLYQIGHGIGLLTLIRNLVLIG